MRKWHEYIGIGKFAFCPLYSGIVMIRLRCDIQTESHNGLLCFLSGLLLTDGRLSFQLTVKCCTF